MLSPRIIARLDIKGPNLIKGIHLEGLRVVGKPAEYAKRYAEGGHCELLYIDTVASLYGRNQLERLLQETTADVFVPVTVGGGVRSLGDVKSLLRAGADMVAINTAAIANPNLIHEVSDCVGSQALTISVEAKRTPLGWEAYTDNGRQKTGKDAVNWAEEAVNLGAGQVLLTSIDQEGTQRGFDLPLIRAVKARVGVPLIASGGAGLVEHVRQAFEAGADAVAVAHMLHYWKTTISELQDAIVGVEV